MHALALVYVANRPFRLVCIGTAGDSLKSFGHMFAGAVMLIRCKVGTVLQNSIGPKVVPSYSSCNRARATALTQKIAARCLLVA